jgi:hypothetical protein
MSIIQINVTICHKIAISVLDFAHGIKKSPAIEIAYNIAIKSRIL